jgi:UDP-GlcNAc:undecaprenyl-phosphate/decaprenyl-phosphate GlcNAc-1-phosphate transferase
MLEQLPLAANRVVFFLLLALLAASLTCRLLTHIALRIGLADRPGGRKQHEGTIPLTGGIGMFVGFVVAALTSGLIVGPTLALVVALGMLVAGGAADDMHDITPRTKFMLQLIAALLMTSWASVYVATLGNLFGFGPVNLYNWGIPFSVVCALGVMNAVNMLDGLDGAAGGMAFVAALWLAYAAVAQGLGAQALLLLLLCAAIAGFLLWNIRLPPLRGQARVFMGDAGSMMLGLALCWFCVDTTQGVGRNLPPIVCVWILVVPLLDMARVMFQRLRRRADILDADREHLHHLLLARGIAPHNAALILVGASALTGAIGLSAWRIGLPEWVLTYAFFAVLGFILLSAHLKERRAGVEDRPER